MMVTMTVIITIAMVRIIITMMMTAAVVNMINMKITVVTMTIMRCRVYLLCSQVSDVSDFNQRIFAKSSPAVLASACSKISGSQE